ncbi:MAG: outer membrane channel protein [Bacteroidetes bacterium ADurb.Bin217]|nr:MAG: outer membrane channel protein [Bacteroidetes bacterium ADurb.Bin217]
MKALYYTVILIACSVQGIYAQQSVSVQQAIDNTLANNYSIRIAKESAQQASIANSYTMTGALPNVQISGNLLPVDFSNSTAFSSESQHMVQVSIPLFNGLHVISSKQQLEALQQQGEIALTITIQNAIALVLQHYYDLVRQQYYTSILETSLDVAQERLHIVTTRQSVGLANDADVLQASIDLRSIEQNISQQKTIIAQSKSELLLQMGIKEHIDIQVTDSITFGILPPYETLIGKLEQNPQLLSAQLANTIAQTAIQQIQAKRYPSVQLFGSYTSIFSASDSYANQTMAGISYVIPIYSRGTYKTQQAVAQSKLNISLIEQERIRHELTTHMHQTYTAYEQNMLQLQKQIDTYEYSKQLLHVIMKRFESNMATMLEVKAAQLSFEQSGYMLANQRYAVKMAEIELLRILCEIGI